MGTFNVKAAAEILRRPTDRAKSDVANKLVAMILHGISRRVCDLYDLRVESPSYIEAVVSRFGDSCAYCEQPLDATRDVVEHLDAMNRHRVGLHVPGNVLAACRACNNEKRRDDGQAVLTLAPSGWLQFLSHDGSRCKASCRSCAYWKERWVEVHVASKALERARSRIAAFRQEYASFGIACVQSDYAIRIRTIYEECQQFAEHVTREIVMAVPIETGEREGGEEKGTRPTTDTSGRSGEH